jgi:hypothetical protein
MMGGKVVYMHGWVLDVDGGKEAFVWRKFGSISPVYTIPLLLRFSPRDA